ncbi:TPA: hypothetical protein ACGJ7L_002302 [Pseudomonas aeruginosa]|uniref:Transmembrane protein n=2 Tax=Pseudomonas aeruginosa TaxID=287 RepID=A0A9P1QZU0_PSEAI|nr:MULTISPECIES: hypothetical protein [Pseudomonas]CDI89693.1 hypothetical protein BN889_01628 [Pseudomonas aeruginosa PA38182]VTS63282.1 Uncharacterised protein [Streptococcus dysgalactiae subsp. equisimilis]AJF49001.1 hypothetical protein EG09_00390 [Pseudomonas aeruginosa]AKE70808.1 hypothetical protein YQ19_22090 [Pseudomonas aeruginosa]ARG50180.1 hypothetical protein BFV99_12870 [Pseudomonas aeruginosa]
MSWERDVVEAVNGMAEEIAEIRKFQEACERDRDIGTLMQLNEKLMTQASNYTNLIMVAGYAGLFGLWSTLVGRLPQWLYALCGLLALLSLLLFVSWEIIKMVWGSLYVKRTNRIITTVARGKKPMDMYQAAMSLYNVKMHKVWLWFFVPTVVLGVGAGLLLVGYFSLEVWCSIS